MINNEIKELIRNKSILIGLSGGADSVYLTHVLYSLKNELELILYTAHMNHNIRGDEAVRDMNFAKSFSESLDIQCFIKTENVTEYAEIKGVSEETAGRLLRYAFFDEICDRYNIDMVATAHNKNDNAETILMNFMRGSSLSGLSGIPQVRGNIIRPILDTDRNEIEKYCLENNLEYKTDSTNLTDDYTRNKIRHNLIPFIQNNFNPNFINTVTKNSKMIFDDDKYISNEADKIYEKHVNNNSIDIKLLNLLDDSLKRRIILKMIGGSSDISSGYVFDILDLINKGTGKQINLPKNMNAWVEYGKLFIDEKCIEVPDFEYELKIGENTVISELGITAILLPATEKINDGAVYFSGNGNIKIRNRRNGDIFYPEGMDGRKKLKEYFINCKIPRNKRKSIGIVTVDNEIACIIGKRADRRFCFNGVGFKIIIKTIKK